MKHPTPGEVGAYWLETELRGDPAEFFDHFEANGWMVGKVPMKNWQAAARNWSRNETKYGRNGQSGQSGHVHERPPLSSDRQAEVDAELAEERRLWQQRNR